MTPEEIRAEAIERAAQAVAALECPGPPGERHYATAEVMVDALGDLLPTGEESSTCFPDEPAADDEAMRRYVTAWKAVTE